MPDRRTISGSVSVSLVEDGVTYQIEASMGSVTIASNASGATLTSTLRFYSKEGAADRAALSCYSCVFKKSGDTYTRVTSEYNRAYNSKQSDGTISNLSVNTSVNAVVVCIYASPSQAHEGYLYELEIPVYKSGDKGDKGDTNKRMPYYAGKLSEVKGTVVVANDHSTPYVDVETGTKDHPVCYIYVGANTSTGKTYPSTAQAYSSSSEWEIMTSDFKWLMTQAVFTLFANVGGFIINGDYWISKYGNLYHKTNGSVTTTVIDADNVGTLYGGAVAYTYFDDTDPMAGTDLDEGAYKFRPTKVINAVSGEEYMAGGKIRVSANGDVDISEEVRVKALESVAANGIKTRISGGIMQVFGLAGVANWVFGVDDNGSAILEYHNNAGQRLYDLGATGLAEITNIEETVNLKKDLYFPSELRSFNTLDGSVISTIYANQNLYKNIFKEKPNITNLYWYGARKTKTGSSVTIYAGTYASTVAKAGAADNKAFFAIADIENGVFANGVYFDVDYQFQLLDGITGNRLAQDQKAAVKATYYTPWESYYPTSGPFVFTWGRFPVYVRMLRLIRSGTGATSYIYILSNYKFK